MNKRGCSPMLRLGLLRHRIEFEFPIDHYYETIWQSWEERIQKGQQEEKQRLADIYESWEGHPDAPDWAADENYMIGQATGSMYAALCVAMWSQCEQTLSDICRLVSKKREYQFHKIKEVCKKHFGTDIEQLSHYTTVDGLRIINNNFKHSNGRYSPDQSKPWTVLDDSFKSKAPIVLDSSQRIQFEQVRFEPLVSGCGVFFCELLDAAKSHIDKSTDGVDDGK